LLKSVVTKINVFNGIQALPLKMVQVLKWQ